VQRAGHPGVPVSRPGGDLPQGGGLALAGGVGGEQRDLGLGAGPGLVRAAGRDVVGQVAGAQADQSAPSAQ
jgi:hypothetical protein